MLLRPTYHDHPFPFFSVDSAFTQEQCSSLESLFLRKDEWQHQDGMFYQCSMSDVTELIPVSFQTEVLARMREMTRLPLVNHVQITAQRMLPGEVIGVHSDRPLLGYEIARLIVQLNSGWRTDHGGVLELFLSQEGKAILSVNPEYNSALGFLLHPNSYHAVTKVTQPRQTIVFNFWHAANTPELAAHLRALFANFDLAEFPAELNAMASAAESSLTEDVTFRAGTAAIALRRWGYEAPVIVAGYQYSAGLSMDAGSDPETYAAVLLADWVAYLYRELFDLERWHLLNSKLAGIDPFLRLTPTWQLCLPRYEASSSGARP